MTQGAPPPIQYGTPPMGPARPGGLTALAVLNFVFGGFAVLAIFGLLALLSLANSAVSQASGGQTSLTQTPGAGVVYFMVLIAIVQAGLLITSGVGYLGLKRTTGYVLGNVYGIVGVANVLLNFVLVGGGFGFMTILGLAYPVITLALLNTTFKNCFTR